MPYEILIVDDEPDIRTLVSGILRDEGFETREARDSASAIAAFRARRPGLVLQDVWLQGSQLDGLQLLNLFHGEEPQVPVVMISGHGTIETAVQAIQQGAYDFVEKPFKADRLLLVVERALEAARLRRENEELRQRAGDPTDLIGVSSAISAVRQAIDRVAPSGSRVLVTGPAGTGKEVVARLIHARSRRAGGPFVVLSCASMRPERLEVELFAGERGYATPKLEVRAAVFDDDGRILMVREVLDGGRWTLPGGWADVNLSPAQNVEKETLEESGYRVRAHKLVAAWDKRRQGHPPGLFAITKLFFLCELLGGEPTPSLETSEIGWFAQHALPADLSVGRVLRTQLERMFEHRRDPGLPTDFD